MTLTTKVNKLLALSVLLGSVFLPTLAQAEVTLKVDDNIKVTAINGQKIKQSLFQPLTKQFTLQPGSHVITAKYDRLYDLGRDEHDYLRSGNVSVAANLEDNQTYSLVMVGQPDEYRAAKKYAERPTLAVQKGEQIVASQQSRVGNNGGILAGLTSAIGGMFGEDDAQQANQRAIAALDNQSSPSSEAHHTNHTENVTSWPSTNTNTLDQFMQLWLQATPSEREKIRQWIAQ